MILYETLREITDAVDAATERVSTAMQEAQRIRQLPIRKAPGESEVEKAVNGYRMLMEAETEVGVAERNFDFECTKCLTSLVRLINTTPGAVELLMGEKT
jgi:hypothetical protein